MSDLRRSSLLLALVALLGVLAMHGISGHLPEPAGDHESASATEAVVVGDTENHSHHDHDHGNEPCSSCGHDSAAMCAFMVLGVIASTRRVTGSLSVQNEPEHRASPRSWSPDPPVPRFGLVPAT